MKISHVLAQCFRHFVRIGSLSLWRKLGVLILMVKESLCRDLDKEVSCRELVQRHGIEICRRDLAQRSCQETLCRDLYRDLAKRSLTQILLTELL